LMGKLSRTKGASFERTVAEAFRVAGFADARRGLSQTRNGAEVPDVQGVDGLWLECKHRIRVNVREALEQAEVSARLSGDPWIPVAVTKENRTRVAATLWFSDFLAFLTRLREAEARVVYLDKALKEVLESRPGDWTVIPPSSPGKRESE